jgi:hypothetical protein
MTDSGGDDMVVYAPPPGYEFMKRDDKVSPLGLSHYFPLSTQGWGFLDLGI